MFRIFLVSTLLSFSLVGRSAAQSPSLMQQQKLHRVYRALERQYVDEVDMAPLVEEAIRSMLGELDPHSVYLDAEEMKQVRESLAGEFSGIGVEFNVLKDTVIVVGTIAGGPAERAGVLPNDRIVRIDTTNAVGFRRSDVPKHLRGTTGSKVAVEVVRRGLSEPLRFVLVRDRIPITTVDAAYAAAPGIGYVKVNRFGQTTMTEFREAMRRLGPVEGLILDLRGNGGGVLRQAVGMAEYFLPRGARIVSTQGRGVPPVHFSAGEDGEFVQGKLAVLIDENSASASEIVAGALQDWDRGVIVGRTSFGKGLVQREMELGDGSAVRITIARYRTPSGRVIQRPYEKGEKEAYYEAHAARSGAAADSVGKDARVFRTRNGRKVYGGGGIRPDVFVEADTTVYSDYFLELFRRGIVGEFALSYMDAERGRLERAYPDVERFVEGYRVTDAMLEGLVAAGREHGAEYLETGFDDSALPVRRHLKALVAQRLFGPEAFYRVLLADDPAFVRALALLGDWEHAGAPLLRPAATDESLIETTHTEEL